jgi:hypothetical protein
VQLTVELCSGKSCRRTLSTVSMPYLASFARIAKELNIEREGAGATVTVHRQTPRKAVIVPMLPQCRARITCNHTSGALSQPSVGINMERSGCVKDLGPAAC